VKPCGLVLLDPSGHLENLHKADGQALNIQQSGGLRSAAVLTGSFLSWVAGAMAARSPACRSPP
jgi:hypothetical protein